MMMSLNDIHLKILVFGPSPTVAYSPGFELDLATKRAEIRTALIADGHNAVFPEDLMKGSIDPSFDNFYLWEKSLVMEYDMVVNLVGSIGAVCEMGLFMQPNLALKAALFFNDAHVTGLAYQQAKAIETIGGKLHTYKYPTDLTSCNLMKEVRQKVYAVRVGKFLAP